MTTHTTGTRDEWLTARLALLDGREGAHAAQRRAGAAAPGAAVGPGRQGLSIRHRRGQRLAGRPLPRALAAARLPLHVRARLQGGLSRPARRSPTGSTASPSIWPTTTSTLSAVSRAPLAKLQAYKQRMGWTFPWASSIGSDFNFDFNVSFTEEQQREGGVEYNYQRERPRAWTPIAGPGAGRRVRGAPAAPTRPPMRATGRA